MNEIEKRVNNFSLTASSMKRKNKARYTANANITNGLAEVGMPVGKNRLAETETKTIGQLL